MSNLTEPVVDLCRCGHAARRHDEDGLCLSYDCDCAQFAQATDPVPNPPAPASSPAPASHPSRDAGAADEERLPCGHDGCQATFTREDNRDRHRLTAHGAEPVVKTNGMFPCPDCGKTFTTGKGVGGHRAKAHPKLPAAAKQGSPSQDGSSAAVPSVRPDDSERLSLSGTATPETPAADVGDAPSAAAGPPARHTAFVYINLGAAGHLDLRVENATGAELAAWLEITLRFLQSTGARP